MVQGDARAGNIRDAFRSKLRGYRALSALTTPEADIGFADEVQSAAGYHTTNTGALPSARTFDV